MNIGVIGTGNIGGAVGRLLAAAGHTIKFGARAPDHASDEVRAINNATVAGVPEAARWGEVVLCAVPYGEWPGLAPQIADAVRGKVVIDAANPNLERDGEYARAALASTEGSGAPVARLLPGARLVRTFTLIQADVLTREAHREGEKLGLPVAGDDESAVAVAAALVRDAGFEPVLAGGLRRARDFDSDTAIFDSSKTAREIADALGVRMPRADGEGA